MSIKFVLILFNFICIIYSSKITDKDDSRLTTTTESTVNPFFGDIQEVDKQSEQMIIEFFSKREEFENIINQHDSFFDTQYLRKSEEKSTIIEPENVGSSSSLSSSSVSSQLELQLCPKRALLLYKLIVNVLQKRIHAHYSKTQSFYQDINIYVFVKAYEIDYLNKHLNQLQYIIDDTLSDKLSEQSKHFCNNLDSIEKTILGLVNRMKFKDESSFQILKDGFKFIENWSKLFSTPKVKTFLTASVILLIVVCWCFPQNASSKKKATFTILCIIILLSMHQNYKNQKREHVEKKMKQTISSCGVLLQLTNWWSGSGYRCLDMDEPIYSHEELYENEFDEKFDPLNFLIDFIFDKITIPLKRVALTLMDLFEDMVDGSKSTNSWDIGSWFRSILISNILKPIFAIFFIILTFKLLPFLSFISIGKKVLNYVLDNVPDVQEDSQAQLQNPIENRRQLLGTHGQSQSSIYNVSNMTINYVTPNQNDQSMCNFIKNQPFLEFANNIDFADDDAYLSAQE